MSGSAEPEPLEAYSEPMLADNLSVEVGHPDEHTNEVCLRNDQEFFHFFKVTLNIRNSNLCIV